MAIVKVQHFMVSSTQTWVKEHLEQIPQNGWLLVTTDQQTAGLGTHGRVWYSPLGNIYATLATKLPHSFTPQKNQFAQVAALSVAEALEQFGFTPQLRWVNDVLLKDKKVSGILAEIVKNATRELCLLIGVGINVNLQQAGLQELASSATSLQIERGYEFDLEEIIEIFLRFFQSNIDDYLNNKNTRYLTERIQNRLTAQVGETIAIIVDGKKNYGIFLGLDEKGQVRLQVDQEVIIFNRGSMFRNVKQF